MGENGGARGENKTFFTGRLFFLFLSLQLLPKVESMFLPLLILGSVQDGGDP